MQLAGGGVRCALAGKLRFRRILRERFGGDLGAYFYGARFSMNGFKSNVMVSVVRRGLCREMVQAAVNFLQMEGAEVRLRCWSFPEHGCVMELRPAQLVGAKLYRLPSRQRHISYCGGTGLLLNT